MEPLLFREHYLLHRSRFEIQRGHQPENALFLLESGCFSCCFSGNDPQTAKPGDFLFFPQKSFFERSVHDPIDFHLIYFKLNTDDPLSATLPQGILPFADGQRRDSNRRIFETLLNRTDDFSVRIKQHVLNDVYFQYLAENPPAGSGSAPSDTAAPVQRVLAYLEAHLSEPVSLGMLAAHVNRSPSALTRQFLEETGTTPIRYLIKLRIRTAKHLLRFTDLPVSDVSARCGYENIYYFSNAFKKTCGCSPSAYRRSLPRV